MSKHLEKVEITPTDTVRLHIVTRDYFGRITKRQQVSFRRRAFEHALRTAEITVPWNEVAR